MGALGKPLQLTDRYGCASTTWVGSSLSPAQGGLKDRPATPHLRAVHIYGRVHDLARARAVHDLARAGRLCPHAGGRRARLGASALATVSLCCSQLREAVPANSACGRAIARRDWRVALAGPRASRRHSLRLRRERRARGGAAAARRRRVWAAAPPPTRGVRAGGRAARHRGSRPPTRVEDNARRRQRRARARIRRAQIASYATLSAQRDAPAREARHRRRRPWRHLTCSAESRPSASLSCSVGAHSDRSR